MFATGGSFVSKIFTVLSVILIIASIIASTRIWLELFIWLKISSLNSINNVRGEVNWLAPLLILILLIY